MKFLLGLTATILMTSSSFAICKGDKIGFEVKVTDETSQSAYDHGAAVFKGNDSVLVYDLATNSVIQAFNIATIENDQNGNYKVSNETSGVYIYFNHETWQNEGVSATLGSYDLTGVKCSYSSIFEGGLDQSSDF